jgi:hypothetical protein
LFLDRAGHVVDVALERRQPVCQPIAIVGKDVHGLRELARGGFGVELLRRLQGGKPNEASSAATLCIANSSRVLSTATKTAATAASPQPT